LAGAKLDAVCIDTQHGTADAAAAWTQLRALQALDRNATPLVRVRENNASEIGGYLDGGFGGVICPMINTKAEAEALVAACRYAPEGVRSWGPTRAILFAQNSGPGYHKMTLDEEQRPLIFAMVETQQSFDNLDEILETGIDGVFIGPADLSISLGEPCAGLNGPKTKAAVATIARATKAKGKRIGSYCITRAESQGLLLDGFDFVVCAHDKILLLNAAKAAVAACRTLPTSSRTTHVGSLPRPAWLLPIVKGEVPPPPDYDAKLLDATIEVMRKQLDVGMDEINDGELGRRDYVTAARQRLSGFDAQEVAPGAKDLVDEPTYSDRHEGRKGLLTLTKKTEVTNAACSAKITYTPAGRKDLQREIDRVCEAASLVGVDRDRVFFSSPSPGTLAVFFGNQYYASHKDFVHALGLAMKEEYAAIAASGLRLQVDCPDLAMGRHTKFGDASLEEFKAAAKDHVDALCIALEGLDASRMRLHVCWGNYPGPHDADVPLSEVADLVLACPPKFISVEACNPGHAHEYSVWKGRNLGDKVFMPGVLDTTTPHVEHRGVIEDRLTRYAESTGRACVACSDCGFSTAAGAMNVPETLVWKKLRSMVVGARGVHAAEQAFAKEELKAAALSELDAVLPGCNRRVACIFSPDKNLPPLLPSGYVGYTLETVIAETGQGAAMHWRDTLMILSPLTGRWDLTYRASEGVDTTVSLSPGELVAVPPGVPRSYRRSDVGGKDAELLTLIPGHAMPVTWDPSVIAAAQAAKGAPGTFEPAPRGMSLRYPKEALTVATSGSWTTTAGSLKVGFRDLRPGETWTPASGRDWTAVNVHGTILAAKSLGPGSVVSAPGPLRAAADPAKLLLIESLLPRHDNFRFDV